MKSHEQLLALGRDLLDSGEASLGVAVIEECAARHPTHLKTLLELANALWLAGRAEAALDANLRAARIAPHEPSVLHNMATLAAACGRLEHEAAALEQLLRADRADAGRLFRFALVSDQLGEFDRALGLYERALALRPGDYLLHVHHGYALLRQGRWREGWRELGWCWEPEGLRALSSWALDAPSPMLRDAAQIEGKRILVTGWGGGGDLVMFTRMAARLVDRGAAHVALHMADSRSFYARNRWSLPVETHTTMDDFLALLGRYDAWVPNASIPGLLGLEPQHFGAGGAYFEPGPALAHGWRRRLGSGGRRKKVGIAWSGGPFNLHRSIPSRELPAFLRSADVDWYVVQKNERNAELETLAPGAVHDFSASFTDLDATAACMSQLDLVISIDSLPAHLAGALGRPVWLLLSTGADWRWGLASADTPWYPGMRIHRQRRAGDWQELLERVGSELRAWCGRG